MLMLSFFGLTGDSRELEGNILSARGNKYEGTVLIEVRKIHRKDRLARRVKAYTGAVDVAVFPTGQSRQQADSFFHRIFFTNEQEEYYRFSVPFMQNELILIFRTEKKSLNLTLKPLD
jgi:hypothetical protein